MASRWLGAGMARTLARPGPLPQPGSPGTAPCAAPRWLSGGGHRLLRRAHGLQAPQEVEDLPLHASMLQVPGHHVATLLEVQRPDAGASAQHTSELQSRENIVCR